MKLNNFGLRMEQLRRRHKLTQTQMGELLDLHYVQVGRYEKGKSVPTVQKLVRISRKLNVTVDWLVFGDKSKTHLGDPELLYLFKELLRLSPQDRIDAKKLVGDFIAQRKAGGSE